MSNHFILHSGLTLLCLAMTVDATANDAAFWGQGARVVAVEEARVRMERETVVIRYEPLVDEQTPRTRGERWHADATFEFRNVTGTAFTIPVGFPDWEDLSETAPKGPGPHWVIRDFRVWVDGQAVAATHREVTTDVAQTGATTVPKAIHDLGYRAAYTWDVTFPPHKTVTVRNTYRFGGFHSNGPFSACVQKADTRAAQRAFWRQAHPPKNGWAFGDGICERIAYIVTTGRTWNGPIGEADITIEIPPGTPPHLFVPTPEATQVTPTMVRWHFKHWRPKGEVAILYARPIPGEGQEGLPAWQTRAQKQAWRRFAAANHFTAEAIDHVLTWIRAAREGRLDDPVLAPYLSSTTKTY